MAFNQLNQRLADEARHRENRARLAHAYVRVSTTGTGVFEFDDRIDFGLTFVERPFIACGWQLRESDADQLRDPERPYPVPGTYPLCTGYVTDWDTTERDHYVGAWITVVVHIPESLNVPTLTSLDPDEADRIEGLEYSGGSPIVEADWKIWHDFTFSGIALKDIPIDD